MGFMTSKPVGNWMCCPGSPSSKQTAEDVWLCVQLLYSNRAQAYISMQRYEQAVQDCESSLRCKFSVKAALRRGTACQALGLWPEAADSFRAVLQREPHNMQAKAALKECEMALEGAAVDAEAAGVEGAAEPVPVDESAML